MKLTFRTIKGTTFNLDAEPTTTVGDLKASLEASQPSMPKEQLKLVYKGKVLEDNSKAISEYNVDESGFLVVFVQKAPAAKPAAAAGNTSSQPAAAEVRRSTQRQPACCMQWGCRTGVFVRVSFHASRQRLSCMVPSRQRKARRQLG